MNRTVALFLALAVLTAHALAIYQAGNGDLAPPYDFAHVAYRLGRHLAHTGRLAWDWNSSGVESYPSLLWVGVSALAERLYLTVSGSTQLIGSLAALATVLVVAQFSPDRLAGVIAPLLLVVSGGLAASALSGTEIPVLTLFVAASFLAFERRWRIAFALFALLTAATRPEGALFVLALFALELVALARKHPDARSRSLLPAFAPAFVAGAIVIGVRWSATGALLSPAFECLVVPSPGLFRLGLASMRDFFVGLGAPALVVFPIWYFARGSLVGTGRRALLLSGVWGLVVASGGGTMLPFAGEMVPILPLLYVSIQSAMTLTLDSSKRGLPELSWTLFGLGMASSALASKYPGDLGPLPVEGLHRAWQNAAAHPRAGRSSVLGRLTLDEEIKIAERLRAAGLFLRDNLDPTYTILSPWPGAIGYLSQLRVIDPLWRVAPLIEGQRVRSWTGSVRSDVALAFEREPEYIVPTLTTRGQTPRADELVEMWAKTLDAKPWSPERAGELLRLLAAYEMIAVPIEYEGRTPSAGAALFFLLRLRKLELAPKLDVQLRDGMFKIEVSHDSHVMLADLEIELRGPDGERWTMRPNGVFTEGQAMARRNLLLFPTGERQVLLAEGKIPPDSSARQLRVALRNPGAQGNDIFTNIGAAVAVSW